jgi:segregation and condensation protein B
LEQTDTPAEETPMPEEALAEDAEEPTEEPTTEERDTPQGRPVPFEEDIEPPARADEAMEEESKEEEEQPVGCAPHTDQPAQDAAETPEADAAANPKSAIRNPQSDVVPTVESVVEAILFATDEPLTDSRLASIVETSARQIHKSIENLNAKYEANNNAFRIEQIAGGYQMLTLNLYNSWLKKMLRARSDSKLSTAALETLAIIAYKQPVIRADIEAVRGVAAGEVIRSLMYKGFVKIVGRAEILGRPMLYGTTKKFLEVFGLNSLKDLPKAEELKKPD